MSAAIAQRLQEAADTTVFGSTQTWNYDADTLTLNFTATLQTGDTYYFYNNSVAPAGATHKWLFSDGTQSTNLHETHTFTGALPYSATLVMSHCGQTDTLSKVVRLLTTRDLEGSDFACYPNPASQTVTLEGTAAGGQVLLYSSLGQLLLQQTTHATQTVLDVSRLPSGWYQMVLYDEKHHLHRQQRLKIVTAP